MKFSVGSAFSQVSLSTKKLFLCKPSIHMTFLTADIIWIRLKLPSYESQCFHLSRKRAGPGWRSERRERLVCLHKLIMKLKSIKYWFQTKNCSIAFLFIPFLKTPASFWGCDDWSTFICLSWLLWILDSHFISLSYFSCSHILCHVTYWRGRTTPFLRY